MNQVSEHRYDSMQYNRCGGSGLKLPVVSLGFWHNFGDTANYETMKAIALTAFDHGITHFDLANNYGPAPRRGGAQSGPHSAGGAGRLPG